MSFAPNLGKKTFWFQTILDFEIVDKGLLYL